MIARTFFIAVVLACLGNLRAAPPTSQPMRVHDPRLAKDGDWYYVFSTGAGIPSWRSRDLRDWESLGAVFDAAPAWTVPDFPRGNYIWAPDVVFFANRFHLYYAVSHFGRNDSAIGHATNATLDRGDARFKWVDHGAVLRTHPQDNWNAIDPSVFVDEQKTPWLVAGSFWSGIKLFQLDPQTGEVASKEPIGLAQRHAPDAIEAGAIAHHGDWYYLFVSYDYCCRGVRSTYKLMVGRSHQIAGPYLDFDKRPMLDGGGTLVLAGYGNVRGPGHAGILHEGDRDLLVHHYYDADEDGRSLLQIRPLLWGADGWPLAGEPINTAATTRPATQADIALNWNLSIDFNEPFHVILVDDGTTRPNIGRWSVRDGKITFSTFSRGNAPPNSIQCFLDPSGANFIGRDHEGAIYRGVRSD